MVRETYVNTARETLLKHYPDYDRPEDLIRLYTLLVLTTGVNTTMKDVHDAWSVWLLQRGRDDDPLLKPFWELSLGTQRLYERYVGAIRSAAEDIHNLVPGTGGSI